MSEAPDPAVVAAPAPEPAPAAASLPGAESLLATAPAGEGTEGGTESGVENKDKVEGDPAKDAVPETYEFKLPDGFQIDEATMGEFQSWAKESKLTQEAAQAGIDLYTKAVTAQAKVYADAQTAAWKEVNDGWKAELEKDPAFTGDAKKTAMTVIGKSIDEYGSPEVRQAFEITGAGNNPALVRYIHNMAKALSEGTGVQAHGPAPKGPQTPGTVLYGNQEGT